MFKFREFWIAQDFDIYLEEYTALDFGLSSFFIYIPSLVAYPDLDLYINIAL